MFGDLRFLTADGATVFSPSFEYDDMKSTHSVKTKLYEGRSFEEPSAKRAPKGLGVGGEFVQENNSPEGPCEVKAIFGGTRLACYFCQQESGGEGAALEGAGLSFLQLASDKSLFCSSSS